MLRHHWAHRRLPTAHGPHGAQRPLCVVSVEQGCHRAVLVRYAIQGHVPAVGSVRVQLDHLRRRNDGVIWHLGGTPVHLPEIQISTGTRGSRVTEYSKDTRDLLPARERW